MKHITLRLKPGQLLKESIEGLAARENIRAGVLLSIVGCLESAVLRMAASEPDNQKVRRWDAAVEIVAGTGTVSTRGCHIHVALSDAEGVVIGGHLKEGCVVKYTAEIVIGVFEDVAYNRVFDKKTGFNELVVEYD